MKINHNLFQYFEQAGTKVLYHPSDIIYMQEDDTTCLYLIIKGRVRVFNITSSGEEITIEILDKGHIFGESSFFQNSPRPTTVVAINEVELIACHLDDLYPYLEKSKELMVSLLQHLSQTCDYLTGLLKKAYTYNRYQKVASFLLEQTITNNINKDIIHNSIPYTHEEVAASVGLSRVTTTKVLNEFAKKGYITNHYKKIIILDKQALSQLLDE